MNVLASIMGATIIFAVPLLLVALGGMCSERSGILNIALEGIMVTGALFSCLLLRYFDASGFGPEHPLSAMLLAMVTAAAFGALFSLLLAFASIHLKADQTISGAALNMLAPAFAIVLSWGIQGQGQTTILIPSWVRITPEVFGLQAGEGFWQTLFFKNFYLTTPVAFLLLVLVAVFLYQTRTGLRLRACGEHPQAAESVGISVYGMRYLGVLLSGFLAGIGGLAFTVAAGSGFQSTVAGYGFLALAVMIFGNWKPAGILGASLLFAFFKVLGAYSASIPFLPRFEQVRGSEYIYLMIPYVVTLLVLIFTSKKSRAPKAEGIPYDKEAR